MNMARKTEMKVDLQKPTNMLIYGASIFSVLLSLLLVRRNPAMATFTGLWAPTIIGLGLYFKENKLLELEEQQVQRQALNA